MEEITLTKENFNISRDEVTNEITATLVNIPEDNKLRLSLNFNSLFGVKKLFINSFSNIKYINIFNINGKPTIILDNLLDLNKIYLINSDIKLILGNELPQLDFLYKGNSKSSEIIDENKIIKHLTIKNQDEFSLDNDFSHIKLLSIINSYLYFPLNCYPELEDLSLRNPKGNFNNINFPKLNRLSLIIIDKFECEFNNCNFDSVESLEIILHKDSKVEEIYINSTFNNLKRLFLLTESKYFKRLNLKLSDKNPIIKCFEVNTSIELSGSLVQHLSEDIKNDYNIILPKGKNAYNIY